MSVGLNGCVTRPANLLETMVIHIMQTQICLVGTDVRVRAHFSLSFHCSCWCCVHSTGTGVGGTTTSVCIRIDKWLISTRSRRVLHYFFTPVGGWTPWFVWRKCSSSRYRWHDMDLIRRKNFVNEDCVVGSISHVFDVMPHRLTISESLEGIANIAAYFHLLRVQVIACNEKATTDCVLRGWRCAAVRACVSVSDGDGERRCSPFSKVKLIESTFRIFDTIFIIIITVVTVYSSDRASMRYALVLYLN